MINNNIKSDKMVSMHDAVAANADPLAALDEPISETIVFNY